MRQERDYENVKVNELLSGLLARAFLERKRLPQRCQRDGAV